jgi:hypothetical protein
MAKYIFCILFGIFLIWGCNLVPDKELQEFRTEAGTTTIQSHNKSQSYRSKAVVKQSGKENNSFQEGKYDGKYDCNIADGILGNSLLSRTTSLSKILRFNVSSVTIRILSSLKYQFPKEKWTGLPYYTNLTKFSYRYYVYTLGRILILFLLWDEMSVSSCPFYLFIFKARKQEESFPLPGICIRFHFYILIT